MTGQEGVVPYVEWHTGPRRTLTIDLRADKTGVMNLVPADRIMPRVGIDGREYVAYWGRVLFEVPADRPVHVAVSLPHDRMQACSVLLNTGEAGEGVHLDYVVDLSTGIAALGSPPAPQA